MRISDWSSDVCSSDLLIDADPQCHRRAVALADADIFGEFGGGVARRLHRCVLRDVEPRRIEPDRRMGLQPRPRAARSEEHTSELQSPMRTSYAVFCLKNKT